MAWCCVCFSIFRFWFLIKRKSCKQFRSSVEKKLNYRMFTASLQYIIQYNTATTVQFEIKQLKKLFNASKLLSILHYSQSVIDCCYSIYGLAFAFAFVKVPQS